MFKRISMVLAATAVMGICMAMVPQKVEGAPPPQTGIVKFKHQSTYPNPPGKHKLWMNANARHWDPKNKLTTKTLWHMPGGPEYVDFGKQLAGKSKGDVKVKSVYPSGICKPSTCYSPSYTYPIKAGVTNIVTGVSMEHRNYPFSAPYDAD